MNKKYTTIGLVILFLLIISSLFLFKSKELITNPTNKLRIVTSFYPIYFLASEITGNKAVVLNITPSGAEPHEYEPTARDIANIEDSNLLILNGGGLENWSKNILTNLKQDKNIVITVGDGLTTKLLTENGKTNTDPHIWLSPVLTKQIVDKIENKISEIDPDNFSYYKENANNLKSKLDTLDSEYKQGLENCKSKDIITSHSAFAYLAGEYNLKQVSIAGLSPEEEPSSKQMTTISKFAKDNNIKYIFFEELISPKLSETIAKEIGAQTLVLDPIEGLTKDEINSGKDYFSEMRYNLNNLKIALQCVQ